MEIEHAGSDDTKSLVLVTGGEIVSVIDHLELIKLRHCDLIDQAIIGENALFRFSGVPLEEACTIVIRGITQQIIDEADRSLHDALCVLVVTIKESCIVYGDDCLEELMTCAILQKAGETAGKEANAMESFARALL